MIITKRLIYVWLILFLPFFFGHVFFKYKAFERELAKRYSALSDYVGTKFKIDKFLNVEGKQTTLEFGKSDVTILDFWHKQCPPCIEEMNQFASLISGKERSVSIVSVSINNYNVWKQLFKYDKKPFLFMSENLSNWNHVLLKSNQDLALKNVIPADNISLLANEYQTRSFPTYFVLDKTGTIIATPPSAVNYIKTHVLNKSAFFLFISNKSLWASSPAWIPEAFVQYSGYF